MSERLVLCYRYLFQLRILHHYWLDEGRLLFDTLPKASRERHLGNYDVHQFLTVTPTADTARTLASFGCIFKTTTLGFVVLAAKSFVFPQDFQLEFALTVKNPDFFNYTALTIWPQPITEGYNQAGSKYRYKKNVALLSNVTGTLRTDGSDKSLYLSKEPPVFTGNEPIESLVEKTGVLNQLTSAQPSPVTLQELGEASKMPVFFHQGDVPAEGILLDGIPDGVFALIRLTAKAPNQIFSLTTAGKKAKTVAPIFQIRFKNRSTLWQYYQGRTGKKAKPPYETEPLPLTFFGNASSLKPQRSKPSQGIIKPQLYNSSVPPKVIGLISEIFE